MIVNEKNKIIDDKVASKKFSIRGWQNQSLQNKRYNIFK